MMKLNEITIEILGKKRTLNSSISLSAMTPHIKGHKTILYLHPHNELLFTVQNNEKKYTVPITPSSMSDNGGKHTTTISKDGNKIEMVEHLLSALYGMNIDGCNIEICGSNYVPIPAFSAKKFVDLILKAGTKTIHDKKQVVCITSPFYYEDGSGSVAFFKPTKNNLLTISALIQFPDPIGEQYLSIELDPNSYNREIAWARSYIRANCTDEYWLHCKSIYPNFPDDMLKAPVPLFNDGIWLVKPKKYDEPVRHKILDALGDLALLGFPLIGAITIIRPGHNFNRNMVQFLSKKLSIVE